MNNKRFPSIIIGLMFLPFGFLLAWVAGAGVIGTLVNCLISFFFGFLVSKCSGYVYKRATKKLGTTHDVIESIMLKSSLYILPFIIIALLARVLLGWSTMMPFIATGMLSYVASSTMEMNKVGMKGPVSSVIPSMIGSCVTMIWTVLFSLLF